MFSNAQLAALVGYELPGGTLTVEPYEDWLLRDALGGTTQGRIGLHPLWALAGLQREMGLSLEQFFALCGSSSADGPMLGGAELDLSASLTPGVTYGVSASIVDAERKVGRRTGTFDLVSVALEARDPQGQRAAAASITYLFPRGQAS